MLTPEGAKFASKVEENKTPGDEGERGVAGGETLSTWKRNYKSSAWDQKYEICFIEVILY